MSKLKTPAEWEEEYNIRIYDPDGWRFTFTAGDGTPYEPQDWSVAITEKEWWARSVISTTGPLQR